MVGYKPKGNAQDRFFPHASEKEPNLGHLGFRLLGFQNSRQYIPTVQATQS